MKPTKKAIEMSPKELARYIDYSVLKPEFTEKEIIELTQDGVKRHCATICINPGYMELCEPYVKNTETMLCPVCDFPFGTSSTESKVQQIEVVAKYDSVKEVDVVANFGWIRGEMYDKVTADLKACADACHKYGRKLKVIFETDALTEEQVRKTCQCCVAAGVDFVKTSTGFLTGFEAHGATPEIIKVMMEEVGDKCQVKGSGCIRTREHFLQLIDMGIDRMGVGYKSVPVVLGESAVAAGKADNY
ncbi:deoxyribose-phosphate aldolase [Propionispora vibrioides]|uniref:Deoxyribose-phosphate aldolase n=1 Tax=Propionispora vibrioides TaxID=112903 RepID=A0A1H8T5Q5_9FIRM|nr:deoxyribose-phosphate aldolase [Propionispora vibrioides]SEO86222.1 deoxyribose-phosphate aldolase [Propionispora vibrioides]